MKYVGIDPKKQHFTATVIDGDGMVLSRDEVPMQRAAIRKYFKRVNGTEPLSVVLKPRNRWAHLYDELEGMVQEVTVAHPANMKAVARTIRSTGPVDSEMLARMLRSRLIPEAYVPSPDTRDKKNLVRYRASLVRIRMILKNMVHALLSRNNVGDASFERLTDKFGTKGMERMKEFRLKGSDPDMLNGYLDLLDAIQGKIKEADRRIKKASEEDDVCGLLKSVPGIGEFFAVLIRYEIGEVERFPSFGKLCSYAGLAPGNPSNGDVASIGGRTGGSRLLRWTLKSAAQKAVLRDSYLKGIYERKEQQAGKKAARLAVARRLLEIIFKMWKEQRPYYVKDAA